MTPIFLNNGKEPNEALTKLAHKLEWQVYEFLDDLRRQGASLTELRAVGGYLHNVVAIAVSNTVLDKVYYDYQNSIKDSDPNLNNDEINKIRQGKRIAAIKAYRDRTGYGLKQSKEAVDLVSKRYY